MLKQILLIAGAICAGVLLLMYVFQRHLIYFPDRHVPDLKKFKAQDMQVVTIHTKDNITLNSWYIPAQHNKPTVLYLHGNAGHIGYRMPLVREFIKSGLGVFLLEYRGYGGNKGSPTEQGFYEDSEAALNYLVQQGITSSEIAVFGESIGTGVATKLASEHHFCSLILQSPFASLARVSRYHYPWLILKPWDQYNSLERIKKVHAPLLILHGTKDRIVPYTEGLTLFQAANQPKKMSTIDNYDHNNLWNSQGFSNKIVHFIKTNCS